MTQNGVLVNADFCKFLYGILTPRQFTVLFQLLMDGVKAGDFITVSSYPFWGETRTSSSYSILLSQMREKGVIEYENASINGIEIIWICNSEYAYRQRKLEHSCKCFNEQRAM